MFMSCSWLSFTANLPNEQLNLSQTSQGVEGMPIRLPTQ